MFRKKEDSFIFSVTESAEVLNNAPVSFNILHSCDQILLRHAAKTIWYFFPSCTCGGARFFVDIYDLLLFSIVRKSSFKSLGVAAADLKDIGENIISWQMIGLTIGGI